jgi:hypothetical protein
MEAEAYGRGKTMKIKRRRVSALGVAAAAGLALGLLTPATLGAWGGPEAPPLPGRAKAVLHFDLERLRESELFRQVEEQVDAFARSDEKLQMFLEAIDLSETKTNLKGFTIYSFSDVDNPQDFAGVLSADFGTETMGRLERAYTPVAREVGSQIIMPVIQTPEVEIVMSFLGPDQLSFGTSGAVEAIAVRSADDPSLVTAFKRTVTQRPIWGIINAKGLIDAMLAGLESSEGPSEPLQALAASQALRSLTSAGFSMDLGNDIFFELRAFTDTAENARLLADAVRGAVAMAQLGASHTDDVDIADFARNIVAVSERDSVYISFTLTAEQMERLQAGRELFPDLIP